MPLAERERIPTIISPDILDTIGNSFNFSHGKGAAEWLKNSLDNYLRRRHEGLEERNGAWPTLLSLVDGADRNHGPNLAVIDFGGTTFGDVQDFFLNWGDRSAATLGGRVNGRDVTGGHGNGGKFYMRQMWRNGARFCTWREGRATSLVVEKPDDGTTGYWEAKDDMIGWRKALENALNVKEGLGGAEYVIEYLASEWPSLLEDLEAGRRGFTVVVGRAARQVRSSNDVVRGARWDAQRLIDELSNAAQARRPIRELTVSVFLNRELKLPRLQPDPEQDDPDWPVDEWEIPSEILSGTEGDGGGSAAGSLMLHKAAEILTGRLRGQHNAIVVLDENDNPVAQYSIRELPIPGSSSVLSFLYGELRLPLGILGDLIQNDRERLNDGDKTRALLEWAAQRIWERVRQFDEKQRAAGRRTDLELASVLNRDLNKHARRFLEELESEIMVDFVESDEGGGAGVGGKGVGPTGEGPGGRGPRTNGTGGGAGAGGSIETPGTTEKVRRPQFPRVLISGYDLDPSSATGEPRILTDGHPPVYQSDDDKQWNVWWINSEHPFAKASLDRGGATGSAFRNYQLFMFQQVVQYETLRILQRRDAELGLDVLEGELLRISNAFLGQLPRDLADSLLG